MKNKVNNFGYLHDYDIKDLLVLDPRLRGCNPIDGDALDIFIPSNLGYKVDNFTYRAALRFTDPKLLNIVYGQLVIIDIITQFQNALVNDGGVFCNFSEYSCEFLDYDEILNHVIGVLKYRGYNVSYDKVNKILTVLNTIIGTTLEDMKIFSTILVKYRLEDKDELVFRGCGELLKHIYLYADLTTQWKYYKTVLNNPKSLQKELMDMIYFSMKFYRFIVGDSDSLSEDLTSEDIHSFIESDCTSLGKFVQEMSVYIDEDNRQLLVDLLREIEEYFDRFFTPDMYICTCNKLHLNHMGMILSFFYRTDVSETKPVTLDFEVPTIETKHFTMNKKLRIACTVLLFIAVMVNFLLG